MKIIVEIILAVLNNDKVLVLIISVDISEILGYHAAESVLNNNCNRVHIQTTAKSLIAVLTRYTGQHSITNIVDEQTCCYSNNILAVIIRTVERLWIFIIRHKDIICYSIIWHKYSVTI
jgi:hypothetical protein